MHLRNFLNACNYAHIRNRFVVRSQIIMHTFEKVQVCTSMHMYANPSCCLSYVLTSLGHISCKFVFWKLEFFKFKFFIFLELLNIENRRLFVTLSNSRHIIEVHNARTPNTTSKHLVSRVSIYTNP